MSERAELGQLNGAEAPDGAPGMPDLHRLSDVPIDLTVEIGRTRLTVGETLELRQGSILTLNRMAGEPVDLLVNGTPIARGEVVVIDEQFGVRITDVVRPQGTGASTPPASTPLVSSPSVAGPGAADASAAADAVQGPTAAAE